jgi:hypothetical protein
MMPCRNINNKTFVLVPHSLSGQTLASRQMSLVDTPGTLQFLRQYRAPVLKQNTVLVIIHIYIYQQMDKNCLKL